MSFTTASAVTKVQQHYPDFPQVIALQLLTDVHNDIAKDVRLLPDAFVDVAFVASQTEYALANTVIRVWEAGLVTGPTTYTSLTPSSVDEYDSDFSGWRFAQAATANGFYIRGTNIGFVPAPAIASAPIPATGFTVGFPFARVYCSQQVTSVFGISDTVPGPQLTNKCWTYGMLRDWAAMYHREDVPMFKDLYEEELQLLIRQDDGRVARSNPTLRPNVRSVLAL